MRWFSLSGKRRLWLTSETHGRFTAFSLCLLNHGRKFDARLLELMCTLNVLSAVGRCVPEEGDPDGGVRAALPDLGGGAPRLCRRLRARILHTTGARQQMPSSTAGFRRTQRATTLLTPTRNGLIPHARMPTKTKLLVQIYRPSRRAKFSTHTPKRTNWMFPHRTFEVFVMVLQGWNAMTSLAEN